MGAIKVMSEDLSNKIAAGEVVERPLSVVKELVENSVDAESKNIYITLKNSGIDYICVVDDGKGMDKDDAMLCFSRHASSKLTSDEMLFKIATLGFRGEALSSIAAVSKVVLETSDGNSSTKTQIEFGKITSQTECKYRKGSIFEVTKLFHNTPARLKYLGNLYSEIAKIISYISKCALANPGVGFKLMNDGKELISTTGSGDILKTVRDIYSIDIAKRLIELQTSSNDVKIDIYAAKPDFQRSNKNYIHVFVNKRVVNSPTIIKTVVECYMPYMPKKKYPFCIINIEIEPELIDVNIHPNKYEIKFSKHDEVLELIKHKLSEYLRQTSHIVEITATNRDVSNSSKQSFDLSRDTSSSSYKYQKQLEQLFGNENYVREFEEKQEEDPFESIAIKQSVDENLPTYYEPIGQFAGTYIIAQNEEELVYIDQHAAVERINYEKNLKSLDSQKFSKTPLLVPIVLEYSSEECVLITNNLDKILKLQIDISEFGKNSFIVREIPSWIDNGFEKQILESIIERIFNNQSIELSAIKDDAIALMSCKESLKANANLSIPEMEYIIDAIFKCDNPYHCPHGRPIIIKVTLKELEKMFKRIM